MATNTKYINEVFHLNKFIHSADLNLYGSLSKRTDAKILIIIFKLLDESLIVFLF